LEPELAVRGAFGPGLVVIVAEQQVDGLRSETGHLGDLQSPGNGPSLVRRRLPVADDDRRGPDRPAAAQVVVDEVLGVEQVGVGAVGIPGHRPCIGGHGAHGPVADRDEHHRRRAESPFAGPEDLGIGCGGQTEDRPDTPDHFAGFRRRPEQGQVRVADLASRSRQTHVVEARRLIIALGRERWVQSTKDLASALEKSADTVTYIQREGVRQRLDDEEFSLRFENLDEALIGRGR
jgi:hypothetical protein